MTAWLQQLLRCFHLSLPGDPLKTAGSRVFLLLALISLPFSGVLGQSDPTPAESSPAQPETFTYRQVGARLLKAYVFFPGTTGNDRPAILLFHGGAWRLGDASWMFDRAKDFAKKGMVAISVDYGLSNDGLSPIDGIEDACAAFTWVREQAEKLGIDPHRGAGYGWSAGGHLVAAAATLPSVRGKAIADSGRPNALLMYSPALNMAKDPYFMQLMAGKGDSAMYSPSEFISRALPPTLIIQGEEDTIVLARDARAFCVAAGKMGARCELHVYPGVGHLLTRNLKIQYKDFDSDPADAAEAHQLEDEFLVSLGYIRK
jgi:acetyl esterase/lipase